MHLSRRALLTAAAAAAIASRTASARATPDTQPVAPTTAGPVSGRTVSGISVFLGVPYAQPPTGALRFASPRPPLAWTGVRDASSFGAPSFQSILPSSEDSLYANVWTPDTNGRRPILVYIHGGGWKFGAANLPTYDGSRLAARADMVVVTFNYRLGLLGFGMHEDLIDDSTGFSSNWGLQDQAALVRWIHDNAEAFGGDPDNITLCGTSAGGSSVWQLALHSELRPLIQRIVPISAAHVWAPALALTPVDSRAVFEGVASSLGTSVAGLREQSAAAVNDTFRGMFSGPPEGRRFGSGREYQGPVVDGHWMRDYDWRLPDPGLPVLSVNTSTEGSYFTGPGSPSPIATPANDTELHDVVRQYLLKGAAAVDDDQPGRLIEAYRAAATAEGRAVDPLSILTEIYGDGLIRYQVVTLAERVARSARAPQYRLEFAHPVRPPWFGTPHESTSPFLFSTFGTVPNLLEFGNGALEQLISDILVDLVSSFAHHGVPASAHAPAVPEFAPDSSSTVVLGGNDVAVLASTPKRTQLRAWADIGWVPTPG